MIDLMAKKMSLPVRVASPAPSSGQRAMSLSGSWYDDARSAMGFMPLTLLVIAGLQRPAAATKTLPF